MDESLLECPLCFDMLKRPHQTECGHTYCLSCILQYKEKGGRDCPLCRFSFSELHRSCLVDSLVAQATDIQDEQLHGNFESLLDRAIRSQGEGRLADAVLDYTKALSVGPPTPANRAFAEAQRSICYDQLGIKNLAKPRQPNPSSANSLTLCLLQATTRILCPGSHFASD